MNKKEKGMDRNKRWWRSFYSEQKKKEIRLAISLSYWISIIATMSCKAIEIYAMGDLPQRINAYQDLVKLFCFRDQILDASQSGKDDDEIDQ